MYNMQTPHHTTTIRYSNKIRFLLTTHVPIILIFWAVLAFMLHEGTLETWYAERPARYAGELIIAKIFFAASVVDVVFTVLRLMFVRKALVISPDGIKGMHAWVWRRFTWDEVDYVRKSLNNLFIVRKPKSLWEKLTRNGTAPGSRYRREVMIVVPLKCVDKSEEDIRKMVDFYMSQSSEAARQSNGSRLNFAV